MPLTLTVIELFASLRRSKEKTTSSAVKGEPSWNLTPLRSMKRHSVGDAMVQDAARAGSTWRSLS